MEKVVFKNGVVSGQKKPATIDCISSIDNVIRLIRYLERIEERKREKTQKAHVIACKKAIAK